jgi:hypothetical protein
MVAPPTASPGAVASPQGATVLAGVLARSLRGRAVPRGGAEDERGLPGQDVLELRGLRPHERLAGRRAAQRLLAAGAETETDKARDTERDSHTER